MKAVSGINHITLAIEDVERSFVFYTRQLGLLPVARWDQGAYLLAGEAWICLSLQDGFRKDVTSDYSHLAFSVPADEYSGLTESLQRKGVKLWQRNHSEGDSLYFLDPDDHKLEIHSTGLGDRLAAMRSAPPKGWTTFVPLPASAA